jgi:K+-sensing histidine kinase KdpD
VGNATLADVIALMQQRQQIYGQYITAKNSAIIPSIPAIPQINVTKAMHQVDDLTRALQAELNHKQALQAWDIALIAGWQKSTSGQAGSFSATIPPYGFQSIPYTVNSQSNDFINLTFSYNINMEPYKHKLADSVDSLMAYRRQQNDGLNQQVKNMQKNISDNLELQRNSLIQIDQQVDHLTADLNRLQGLDSIEALRLRSQIRISLAIASMEDHLARFTIKLLSTDNYAQNR